MSCPENPLGLLIWSVVHASCFSHVQFFATLWIVACQVSVRGIFQARILEWVAMLSSRESSLMSPELANGFFTISATWEALSVNIAVTSLLLCPRGGPQREEITQGVWNPPDGWLLSSANTHQSFSGCEKQMGDLHVRMTGLYQVSTLETIQKRKFLATEPFTKSYFILLI